MARRCGSFCNQHEPAGLAVEPVHDRNLSATSDLECEQFAQLFPQRRCAVWLCGVNEKERRFVDDHVIVGFIDDFKME